MHHGMINKEVGFSLSSVSGMQSRFFVIDIDDAWRPLLSYYKEQFQPSARQPGIRPDALGSYDLSSFSFTPTKKARSSHNLRSWRIDVETVAKGHSSASRCDKLVLEFNSDQDCHEWQAALRLCKIGLREFAEERAYAASQALQSRVVTPSHDVQCSALWKWQNDTGGDWELFDATNAVFLERAFQSKQGVVQHPTMPWSFDLKEMVQTNSTTKTKRCIQRDAAVVTSHADVLCGRKLALDIPSTWLLLPRLSAAYII
jgi:hypothetical protein